MDATRSCGLAYRHFMHSRPKRAGACKPTSLILRVFFRQQGADIEARDRRQSTALAIAANYGHAVAVRQLLRMGADPNTATYAGNTPLHQSAARFGVSQADTELASWGGFGREKDYQQIIADLIRAGTKINARNSAGQSALTLTALHGRRDTIEILKAAGATR